VIRTTPEHPFYVRGRGWIPTALLEVGDWLRGHDGRCLPVEAVTDSGEVTTVYNLCVAEYHTYFVGGRDWDFSIWAHNASKIVYKAATGATKTGTGVVKRAKPTIRQVANKLAPKLPRYKKGGKTSGVLRTTQGDTQLVSGYNGPARNMPKGSRGMHNRIKSHVEAHAAAIMHQQNLKKATLYINRRPCPGKWGCDKMLRRMLPPGATLEVRGPRGFQKVYTGLP